MEYTLTSVDLDFDFLLRIAVGTALDIRQHFVSVQLHS